MIDRPRCRCGKKLYASWSDARHDCRRIRRNNKRLGNLVVYYSRHCRSFHLGRATNHMITKARKDY